MTSILTAAEAATFVRTEATDTIMLALLPMVDEALRQATGHDWTADATIDKAAKLAAGTLLVTWYDNPSMVGSPDPAGPQLAALEAKALAYRKYEFAGRNGEGPIALAKARKGDVVITLVGTYGASGDQSDSFEAIVSDDGQLLQTDGADLSENLYAVVLKHPADDLST